jgi:hypothetical protein
MRQRFPWAKPRFELALLVLVAAAALSPVYASSVQDTSRLCLTRALEHGHVVISPCIAGWHDRAVYDGRLYSDKAPGMSVLALPATAIVRLPAPSGWKSEGDLRVWVVRLLTSGIAFVLLAFLTGRVAEGLVRGSGALTLVALSLGTMIGPLAATTFSHVTSATLAFGAFLLLWSRRPALGGLAAGLAVDNEYTTALIGAVLAVYALRDGSRALARYAAGAVPPLVLLAVYDWAAFGSPFHLSYRYVANGYTAEQHSGFFGIGGPHLHSLYVVLAGHQGLFVVSPVLVAAAAGLAPLARRLPAEAAVCAAATVLFLLVNVGYFLPYGGLSPGPRFFVPALPFLALGLPFAIAAARWVVVALTAASLAATTAVEVSWALAENGYHDTVWGQIALLPRRRGASTLVQDATHNVLDWLGSNRTDSAAAVALCVAAAFVLALPRRRPTPS